jgi:hypothetical protein
MKATGFCALALVGGLALPVSMAAAQTVGGTAYGASVSALGISSQSPVAALPAAGGYATAAADAFTASTVVTASGLNAVSTGTADNQKSGSQSVSELENVSVLGGVIQAQAVTAVVSSWREGWTAGSEAAGSGFTNLVVNGVTIVTEVAPNTRVNLPGVGYVVLNEQVPSGDGVNSSGISVTMIHVVLQDALTGATTGEIRVGTATSSVTR